jgi:hypothetical protein
MVVHRHLQGIFRTNGATKCRGVLSKQWDRPPIMEIHHMRAPSGGHVGSSVEFQLFIWRTTGERRNTYGSEDLADPDRPKIQDRARHSRPDVTKGRRSREALPSLAELLCRARGPGAARQALGQEPAISIRAERG